MELSTRLRKTSSSVIERAERRFWATGRSCSTSGPVYSGGSSDDRRARFGPLLGASSSPPSSRARLRPRAAPGRGLGAADAAAAPADDAGAAVVLAAPVRGAPAAVALAAGRTTTGSGAGGFGLGAGTAAAGLAFGVVVVTAGVGTAGVEAAPGGVAAAADAGVGCRDPAVFGEEREESHNE